MGQLGEHILIAEDELIVAHSIQLRLEQHGYVVNGIAKTGDEAIRAVHQSPPDLILMDIRLSGELDGITTAERVRQEYGVPVIFLTAYSDDETLARAKITEPFGYIIKPFETRELINNIEIALYRRKMNDALQASEAQFRGLFENATIGLALVDEGGDVVAANRSLERLLGSGDRSGEDGLRDQPSSELRRLIQSLESERDAPAMEQEVVGADGVARLLTVGSASIPKGPNSPARAALFVEDITSLRRYEQQLRERQEGLRALFVNVEAIRMQERTSLSRDIHDVLGQMLTAHKMDLHWLRSRIDSSQESTFGEMIDQIDEMIVFVKRVCSELRDNVLDVFGFDVALEEHLKQFQDRNKLSVDFVSSGDGFELGGDRQVSLLRIIQESLTNIARHAQATTVSVRCAFRPDGVEWTIADDGVGFAAEQSDGHRSLGLIGMKERAAAWGGEVAIQSEPGSGTRVTVWLPKEPKSNDQSRDR